MYDLHTFIFWICVVIFVARVRRDVLLDLQAPEVGRARGAAVPREHDGRDRLDGDPVPDPAVHGVPGDEDDPRDEGHVGARHDRSRSPGYQWKWNYDYLQEGFGFYSNLATPLAQIENRAPKGEHYLLEVDNPLVVPVDTKVRAADHRRRRAPRVVGAGVRRQAGRDSRLRPRHVVQGREGRHLPRPVRRALRQGARLHADRRRGEVEGRLREVGRRAEEEGGRGRRRLRTRSGTLADLVARGEKVFAANCAACHQATGKGVPGAFPALDGSKIVNGPKADADRAGAERQARHGDGRRGSSSPTPTSPR